MIIFEVIKWALAGLVAIFGFIFAAYLSFRSGRKTEENNIKIRNMEEDLKNAENYKQRQIERDSTTLESKREFLRNHRLGKE